MIDIGSIFVLIGLFFTILELHQNRKSQLIEISQEFKRRYDSLNEDRKKFYAYYRDKLFDIKELKKKNQEIFDDLMHWEARYYWYCFDQWIEGHVRHSLPKKLRKDIDYMIKSSMSNPVHKQAWKEGIREIDFLGYREFNGFIETCIKQSVGK
jgi:hypothetical protein